jgi:DNA repair protein RecN (Recombination protein N)
MITFLRVRNLATIEDLELRFDRGFSILTGETGAGKSVIIDAIRLLLGDKASADLVRTGSREAAVEAGFDVSGAEVDLGGIPPAGEGQLFIQRQVSPQGSGKAYINGVLVPVRRLKELGPQLVDIYGQNDHVFLLHLENHLRFLDDFLADSSPVAGVARAARELRALLKEKADLEAREREREQRLDFVSFQVREIEAADLKPGEDQGLLRQRDLLKNAEKIAALVDRALEAAYLREDSIVHLMSDFRNALGDLAAYDPSFGEFRAALQESAILVKDAAEALIRFKDRTAEPPEDPEALEERLSVIEKLKRKYGPGVEDVLERLAGLRKEMASLTAGGERREGIASEIGRKFDEYSALAGRLAGLRAAAAADLERRVEKEIAVLGMKKARFSIQVTRVAPSAGDPGTIRDQGTEDVEFLMSPNPGEEIRPLRRIASGGELSRIMLSLKSLDKESGPVKTLIFDEIDAGIGGRTAECIARKLRALASRHQVICITHLPQIAASASHHFRVDKTVARDRTFTTAGLLGSEERISEIARLVSGSRLTEAALEIARELLTLDSGKETKGC